MNYLKLIEREYSLLDHDIKNYEKILTNEVNNSSFLVIGGAGSIGQEVVKEIFKRSPKKLHVLDISENNLVELVRDIRSSFGYIDGDFSTFTVDSGSIEFEALFHKEGPYDYVINLAAMKHVRSEKDPYTLMRMIEVNILNTIKSLSLSIENNTKKYFCVSTDKAANPVNMMGASKRIMEMFLQHYSKNISISTARFANVVFSDGSLLQGVENRIKKKQPVAGPSDVKRYFVTPEESGQICLMSIIIGKNNEIFFPKLDDTHLINIQRVVTNYLRSIGYKPLLCSSEEEAKAKMLNKNENEWPCLFTPSDTTGEKSYEEFFTENENANLERYSNLGVLNNNLKYSKDVLVKFLKDIEEMKSNLDWSKVEIIQRFKEVLPNFVHEEKNKYLDGKM